MVEGNPAIFLPEQKRPLFKNFFESTSIGQLIGVYGSSLNRKSSLISQTKQGECKKVKVAIIGASLGGCSTAYYLESLFREADSTHLEIDIYDKEDDIGGTKSDWIQHMGVEYNLKKSRIDFTQTYMRHFARLAECVYEENKTKEILFDSKDGILCTFNGIRSSIKALLNVRYFPYRLDDRQFLERFDQIVHQVDL